MRWKTKIKSVESLKTERVRHKFLFIPHQFGDTMYWLERVWVVETLVSDTEGKYWDTWGKFDTAEEAEKYREAHNLD